MATTRTTINISITSELERLFVLTPEAKKDLKEIFLDIAEDSPDTAERVRSEFYERLQNLGPSPGIGHYHEEFVIHGAPILLSS